MAAIGIVLAYSLYADLGMLQAVGRQIPIAMAGDQPQKARELSSYGLLAQLSGTSVVAVGLIVFLIVRGDQMGPELRFGLLTAVVSVLLQGLTVAQHVILQARREFGKASALLVVTSFGALIAALAGGLLAGVHGVFLAQAGALALSVLAGFRFIGVPPGVRPRWSSVRHLIREGIPLAALLLGGYGLVYIDQVMVLWMLGRHQLGIYTLVLYTGAIIMLLPTAVAKATNPRLLMRYSRDQTVQSITDLTWRPVTALSVAMPSVILAGWILAPILVRRFFPLFVDAITPLRVYAIAVYFLGLNAGVSSALVALDQYRKNIPIVLGAVLLNVAVDIVLIGVLDTGLPGAAVGSGITYFAYWLASSGLVRWFFDRSAWRATVFNLKMGWPGFVLAAFGLASWRLGFLNSTHLVWELAAISLAFLLAFLNRRSITAPHAERPA